MLEFPFDIRCEAARTSGTQEYGWFWSDSFPHTRPEYYHLHRWRARRAADFA